MSWQARHEGSLAMLAIPRMFPRIHRWTRNATATACGLGRYLYVRSALPFSDQLLKYLLDCSMKLVSLFLFCFQLQTFQRLCLLQELEDTVWDAGGKKKQSDSDVWWPSVQREAYFKFWDENLRIAFFQSHAFERRMRIKIKTILTGIFKIEICYSSFYWYFQKRLFFPQIFLK